MKKLLYGAGICVLGAAAYFGIVRPEPDNCTWTITGHTSYIINVAQPPNVPFCSEPEVHGGTPTSETPCVFDIYISPYDDYKINLDEDFEWAIIIDHPEYSCTPPVIQCTGDGC